MKTERLEAFTDGVVAIAITIMVLNLPVPRAPTLDALNTVAPVFLAYVLSFINVGIFWSNHHHLLQAADHADGRVLLANLFLLFWISLLPFIIRWVDEAGITDVTLASYGVVQLMTAIGYNLLTWALIAVNGRDSALAQALGNDVKGKVSLGLYVVGIALAFLLPLASVAVYVGVAAIWLIPDRRIEQELVEQAHEDAPPQPERAR